MTKKPRLCKQTPTTTSSDEELSETLQVLPPTPYIRRVPRPPRNLPPSALLQIFRPLPRNTPGSHLGIVIDDSGGVVSLSSENATCVVEIEAQQAASEGIEASPTFVLRGDVESDGSQVSHMFWDTPESVATPSDFLHDWEGSSSDASATNIPEDYRYQLVGNDGGRVRYSDYYYSATRTLRDHYVQAAIRNDAREADAMQATTGLIAFEESMHGRIRPRPAHGGMFFGPPGPTPPTSDTGEPWDSDEQWGSVRGTPSPDGCEADDEDESAASEEPVPLVPAVRPPSPVRGAASRVWEPDEDFVPP
jgi:hypothetical protein